MKGRHIAGRDESAGNPEVELHPAQIEALVAEDWDTWVRLTRDLRVSAVSAPEAIAAKNRQRLVEAGDAIDRVCESCHLRYWYPLGELAGIANAGPTTYQSAGK